MYTYVIYNNGKITVQFNQLLILTDTKFIIMIKPQSTAISQLTVKMTLSHMEMITTTKTLRKCTSFFGKSLAMNICRFDFSEVFDTYSTIMEYTCMYIICWSNVELNRYIYGLIIFLLCNITFLRYYTSSVQNILCVECQLHPKEIMTGTI